MVIILDQMMVRTAVAYQVDRKVDMVRETESPGRETEESLRRWGRECGIGGVKGWWSKHR